jgi:hypothetical protein
MRPGCAKECKKVAIDFLKYCSLHNVGFVNIKGKFYIGNHVILEDELFSNFLETYKVQQCIHKEK